MSKKHYILATIQTNHKHMLSLYSSMRNYIHSTHPMPNQVQLVYITPSNQRIIQIDDSVKTIYISRLKGKGIAKITDFTYNIDQDDLTIQNRLLNTTLVIRNNYTENPLLVAIKYLQEPPPKVRIIIPGVKDEKKEEKIFSENPTMFQFHVTSPADRKYIILRTYNMHYSSGPLHYLCILVNQQLKIIIKVQVIYIMKMLLLLEVIMHKISLLLFIVLKNVMVNYHFIEVIMFIC